MPLSDIVNVPPKSFESLNSNFTYAIFAQNNGMIQLTGVASRYVGYFIAGMLFTEL